MKRFVTICSLLLVFVLRAEAQRLAVEATLKGKAPEGLQLYLMSVAEVGQNRIDTFRVEGNKARVTTAVSPYAVYKLVDVAGQTQMIRPLSFPAGKAKAKMTVTFKDKQMNVGGRECRLQGAHGFRRPLYSCSQETVDGWKEHGC